MRRILDKNGSLSLRTLILGVVSLGFVILLIATYWIRNDFLYSSRSEALTQQGSELLATGNVEIEEIVPGLLLSEEKGALDYILQRIKQKDNLVRVEFLPNINETKLGQCRETSHRSSLCLDMKRNVVRTAHRAEIDGQVLGFLVKEQEGKSIISSEIERPFLHVFIVLVSVLMGVVIWIAIFLQRYVRQPILSLEETLRPALNGTTGTPTTAKSRVSEIQSIFDQVQTLVSKYQDSRTQAALGHFASQVGHDLISPITSLRMTIDSAEGVSDSDRKRISAAIERVRNIASTLREKQRKILSLPAENANVLSDEKSENVALTPLIETTLNDKKHLYKENRGLRFSFSNESAEGSATKIQKIEFQRLLSNLLDNAVEALQGEGQVSVLLSTHNEFITIGISDTGIGIPKELITKLGQRGVTVGKINGLGLGLFHARTTIESWGGTLNIQSELGKGTTIQIQLPNSKPNFKYVSKIEIQNDTEIIGVDDASEMGEVWRTAFKGRPNPIRTFSSVNDFENWFSRNKNSGESRLFLFDLEIGKSKTDGIDLIKKYNLFPQSILVTGSFDNESVIARCRAVKIRVLPKTEIDKVLIMSAVTASSPEPARRVWEGK